MTYYSCKKGTVFLAKTREGMAMRTYNGSWIKSVADWTNEKLTKVTAKTANTGAGKTLAQELKDGTL